MPGTTQVSPLAARRMPDVGGGLLGEVGRARVTHGQPSPSGNHLLARQLGVPASEVAEVLRRAPLPRE
eukprot:3747431-Heterocapsa_arctica.AAC.1